MANRNSVVHAIVILIIEIVIICSANNNFKFENAITEGCWTAFYDIAASIKMEKCMKRCTRNEKDPEHRKYCFLVCIVHECIDLFPGQDPNVRKQRAACIQEFFAKYK
ncbi:hypothetical protein PIB30_101752 [Stylosanthes scabra]|uniref:Uncharacterized protein n=1 Tax=Stylosanthes scabra TaxID=79078 RepID=A0ABU6VYI1_9FABA|nr:hypothetical protein [Stylosanthes scabra]